MTSKEIETQITNLESTLEVAEVYQQVAAMRMRKIKTSVMKSRDFYNALLEIYAETQNCYLNSKSTGKKAVPSFKRKHNGKTVMVLISANTGLYGNVIKEAYEQFIRDQKNLKCDLVVIGRVGRIWTQVLNFGDRCKYFELGDGVENIETEIMPIYNYVSKYKEVVMYHGIFKNITQQPVKITHISQEIETNNKESGREFFLFEPTIDKVLETFGKQLMYSFFDQEVYEASLAKFGARMMNLDTATQNISKKLASTKLSSIKVKHRKQNKRQIEAMSGMTLWK